jgi:hypothetical protein
MLRGGSTHAKRSLSSRAPLRWVPTAPNDQGASKRALKVLADYRNYRRYDIVRTSPVGTTRLSTWGTGSGGELETPFYVVRSAVLSHALGHFGRERREASALRLMRIDSSVPLPEQTRCLT